MTSFFGRFIKNKEWWRYLMLFLTAPSASIILLPIEQAQAEGFVRRNGGTAIVMPLLANFI